MEHSVITLLNSLDMSLDLDLTAAGGTTDIWAVLAPILNTVLTMNNQNVKDALEAIEKNGVDCVVYGHLHRAAGAYPFECEREGVRYLLTSCDLLDFRLARVY